MHAVRIRRRSWAIAGAVAASIAAPLVGQSYFYTGQTGAQVQVDRFHTQRWSVTTSFTLTDFLGGRFKMKAGPQTAETVTFTFFRGSWQDYLDGAFTPMMSVTRTAAEVGWADFTFIDFFAANPLTLDAGVEYTGVLHSLAPQPQSRAYFIKDSFEFVDPIPVVPGLAPLPGAAVLAAAGIAMTAGRGRRRVPSG